MNPHDLVPLVAIVMGGLTVLVPIVGITARFTLKPIVEALTQYRSAQGRDDAVHLLERRFALMEDQIQGLERSVHSLVEEARFHRELTAPAAEPVRAQIPGVTTAE